MGSRAEYAFFGDYCLLIVPRLPGRGDPKFRLFRRDQGRGKAVLELTEEQPLRVLDCLLRNPNEPLPSDTILSEVGYQGNNADNYLSVQVKQLRKYLNDDSKRPRFIKNHRGYGYEYLQSVERFIGNDGARKSQECGFGVLVPSAADDEDDQSRPGNDPSLDEPFAPAEIQIDFTYRTRATRFVGRTLATAALHQFLKDPRPGLWTLVSGPTGTGKNRLVAELIAEVGGPEALTGKWRAGFLLNGETWLRGPALEWRTDTDTLIVIDDAGKFDRTDIDRDALRNFLAYVRAPHATAPGKRIRVILIDRLPLENEQCIVKRLAIGFDRRGEVEAAHWKPAGSELTLRALDESDAIKIAQHRAETAWTPETYARVKQAIQNDSELGRPLFAFLIGDAIRSGLLPTGVLNPVTVTEIAYNRLFANYDPAFLEETKTLWAAGTACHGASEDSLLGEESLLALLGTRLSDSAVRALRRHLRHLSGSPPGRIVPLQPDYLGGLLVLRHLLDLPSEQCLKSASALMTVSWKHGLAPDSFIQRLIFDFIGRLPELAAAANCPVDRARQLLLHLVLCGKDTPTRTDAGVRSIADCAYLASMAGQSLMGFKMIKGVEDAYTKRPNEYAADLAEGWFGLALAGDLSDLPTVLIARARKRIEELFHCHNTPEIALVVAKVLTNASADELDLLERDKLAQRVGEIRKVYNTRDIAIEEAKTLHNTTVGPAAVGICQQRAGEIGAIRLEYNLSDIALEQAKALVNASSCDIEGPWRERIANEIEGILRDHETDDIAQQLAFALANVTMSKTNPVVAIWRGLARLIGTRAPFGRRDRMLRRIEKVRSVHNTPEIALVHAMVLQNATADETSPSKCIEWADRIGRIRREHNTIDIALVEAKALGTAAIRQQFSSDRERLVDRIGVLRTEHNTADTALVNAMALHNVVAAETDAARCEEWIDRIEIIRTEYDTAEVAIVLARALLHTNRLETEEPRANNRRAQIEELLHSHSLTWEDMMYSVPSLFTFGL